MKVFKKMFLQVKLFAKNALATYNFMPVHHFMLTLLINLLGKEQRSQNHNSSQIWFILTPKNRNPRYPTQNL